MSRFDISEIFGWLTGIIAILAVASVILMIFYFSKTYQQQSYQNNANMMQNAQRQCGGHLLFFTEENQTNHPIVVCGSK